MLPGGEPSPLSWLHPVFALAATGLLAYAASLGLRSRERGGAHLRPRHRRLAPMAACSIFFSFVFGIASTLWLRPDLELAQSPHFKVGTALVVCLSLAALVSRKIPTLSSARLLHPALGLAALLLAALQIFFGLRLLRL